MHARRQIEERVERVDWVLGQAAAPIHDGPTAFKMFENADVRPRDWVLVLGAASGLGILLIQLAHAAGAGVIGAARGQRKLELARQLGANGVIDYSKEGWIAQAQSLTESASFDVVFDGVGGAIGEVAFELLTRGGRFSAHGAPSGAFASIDTDVAARREVTVSGIEQVQLPASTAKRLTEHALNEAATGRIRAVVGQTFSACARRRRTRRDGGARRHRNHSPRRRRPLPRARGGEGVTMSLMLCADLPRLQRRCQRAHRAALCADLGSRRIVLQHAPPDARVRELPKKSIVSA